jgi:hypothetical protein
MGDEVLGSSLVEKGLASVRRRLTSVWAGVGYLCPSYSTADFISCPLPANANAKLCSSVASIDPRLKEI